MTFDLAYLVSVPVDGQPVRKLIFEPAGVAKDSPEYLHASLLAGPWRKQTKICKGLKDGEDITTPFPLPLRLKNSKHGDILVPNGCKVQVVDPVLEPVIVKETGAQRIGKDLKPVFNLKAGQVVITTYIFAAGDDDDAFSRAGAPAEPVTADDEAFA